MSPARNRQQILGVEGREDARKARIVRVEELAGVREAERDRPRPAVASAPEREPQELMFLLLLGEGEREDR